MSKKFFGYSLVLILGLLLGSGLVLCGMALGQAVDWHRIPEPGLNDHYDGKLWKVVKSIPAHEIVDQAKLKELGGEKVYFFSTHDVALPSEQEVYCVILRHPNRGVQIGE